MVDEKKNLGQRGLFDHANARRRKELFEEVRLLLVGTITSAMPPYLLRRPKEKVLVSIPLKLTRLSLFEPKSSLFVRF